MWLLATGCCFWIVWLDVVWFGVILWFWAGLEFDVCWWFVFGCFGLCIAVGYFVEWCGLGAFMFWVFELGWVCVELLIVWLDRLGYVLWLVGFFGGCCVCGVVVWIVVWLVDCSRCVFVYYFSWFCLNVLVACLFCCMLDTDCVRVWFI